MKEKNYSAEYNIEPSTITLNSRLFVCVKFETLLSSQVTQSTVDILTCLFEIISAPVNKITIV